MSGRTLRFAVFGNEYQGKKSVAIQKILSALSSRGAVVAIDRPFYDFLLAEHVDIKDAKVFDADAFDADFAISMGGDGTFLRAATRVGAKGLPVIGVNLGRLGFLSDTMPDDIETAVDAIHNGDYRLENHSVIEVDAEGETMSGSRYALNDIAVLKRDTASMITIRACVDGEYVVTYQADGLIVSTPTGSTAYGLSNGGPIVVPGTDVLCLTPVAPHSLNIRSIVINGNSEVTLTAGSRSHNFLLAIDGRSEKLPESAKVTIRKAAHNIKIVKLPNKHYYATLREKMMWGMDSRENKCPDTGIENKRR